MIFFNDNEKFVAQWLRNLYPTATVDERTIHELRGSELQQYKRCHFFAGIGGWEYALQLAGWPEDRPVWTGSCPCQPFSSAARGHKTATDIWPEWLRLISSTRPSTIFGEQVASAGAWFDRVCDDLEALDYSIGAAILPATAVGKDHARYRIYFVGHANSNRESSCTFYAKAPWMQEDRGECCAVAKKNGISFRMGQLRAYGNAIVPQVAAEFITAFLESERTAAL